MGKAYEESMDFYVERLELFIFTWDAPGMILILRAMSLPVFQVLKSSVGSGRYRPVRS